MFYSALGTVVMSTMDVVKFNRPVSPALAGVWMPRALTARLKWELSLSIPITDPAVVIDIAYQKLLTQQNGIALLPRSGMRSLSLLEIEEIEMGLFKPIVTAASTGKLPESG